MPQFHSETAAVAPSYPAGALVVEMRQSNSDAIADVDLGGGLDKQPGSAEIAQHPLAHVGGCGEKDISGIASTGFAPPVCVG